MAGFVHVKGLDQLNTFLDQLPDKLAGNVMRGALRAGAVVIRDQAKANVPVKSGLLRDGLKVGTGNSRGIVRATVRAKGKHAFLAKWIEYGVAAHVIRPTKRKSLFFGSFYAELAAHPGIRPMPFLRPALDNRAQDAVVAVANQMKKRLTKAGLAGAAEVDIEV